MSYCVNCGVELSAGAAYCPLCGVEVLNPRSPVTAPPARRYPDVPIDGYRRGYRDLVLPLALMLLLPVGITLACDWLISGRLSWSLYVAASIALAGVFILLPLGLRRSQPILCVAVDALASGAFLGVLNILIQTSRDWFFPIALPITGAMSALALTVTILFTYSRMGKLVKLAVILFALAVAAVAFDCILSLGTGAAHVLSWSPLVAVPCIILGAVALLIHSNRRLKEKMRQRFFI